MPGKSRSTPALEKSRSKRRKNRTAKNRAAYRSAVELANTVELQLAPAMSIADVMELLFRRVHALWHHAAAMVDGLDPNAEDGTPTAIWQIQWDAQGNPVRVPHKWIASEVALREELWEMATDLQSLNIDERRVRIEEAQMEILGRALAAAAKDAGLTEAQQRNLGSNLRQRLMELAPPPAASTISAAPSQAA